MKKRNLIFGLVCLSALILGACSKGGQTTSSSQQGGESPTTSQSTSEPVHVHNFVFDKFIWTETPGAYTAAAQYKCTADNYTEIHDATVTKVDAESVAPTCEEGGKNVWLAQYDGHEEKKTETLPSLGGHEWGEPEWTWYGLNTEARATFTCLKNDEHTHVETATVENGGIVEFENIEPTCIQDGHITYRATVEFNGQTYFDDRVDNIPAYEHSDIDGYGFCELCGEYQGAEIEDPDVQMDFDYLDAGNYFYRFAINSEALYKKVLHNIPSAECLFFGMRNEAWESISISASNYVSIEETDDNYLYIVLNLTAPVENAYFRFDMDCAHNYIDSHCFCTVCGEYCGLSIEEANWDTSVVLPDVDGDETLFFRFAIDDEHHYTLVIPGNNWIQACRSEKYYLKSGNVLTEISLSDEFYGVYSSSVSSRTDPKDFFNLNGRPNDGYLYAVYKVDSQDSIGGGDAIIVSTEHNPRNSMPGFCFGGDYLGTTINIGYTVNTGHMSKNQSNYYRFADPGDYKIKSICNSPLQDSYFTFYRMTESHELEEITIDDTFRNLEETADGYYYIKLTAGAALDDGPFQIKAEAVTFTVAFYAKFITEDNIAALTEGLTDYFNPKLVNLQFVTLGDGNTNVGAFAGLITSYNDENENDIDVLIGANGDSDNALKNAGYQKLNETSYSYGTDAKRKLWCKTGNTSDQHVLEVQAYLAANWAN